MIGEPTPLTNAYNALQTLINIPGYAPVVSDADAEAISNGAMSALTVSAATQFYNDTGDNSFYYLPSATQTALTDVIYNAGNYGSDALPSSFAPDLLAEDWQKAAADLEGSSNSRYRADGELIAGDIANGNLVRAGSCKP